MTVEQATRQLRKALNTITPEEYPELCDYLSSTLEEGPENIYTDPYPIAQRMHNLDSARQLPQAVADFIIAAYSQAVAAGNADAACDLGSLYYTGRAGEQDYAKAVHYYEIAARGGCGQARENLGYCYYYGRSVEVDYEKAFHYFALGAFTGHLCSLYKIGDMYRYGCYVEKNAEEAFQIYCHCYERLTPEMLPLVGADILMRLGDCYFEGIGTRPDHVLALAYYQKATKLFEERLAQGDVLIRGNYEKVIARQGTAVPPDQTQE